MYIQLFYNFSKSYLYKKMSCKINKKCYYNIIIFVKFLSFY